MDRYRKYQTKEYADKRRHAQISDLTTGDKILIKQRKENKLTKLFSPEEHTVVSKKGNAVVAQSQDGKIIKRNSTHFQKVLDRDVGTLGTPDMNSNDLDEAENNHHPLGTKDTYLNDDKVSRNSQQPLDKEEQSNRPKRVHHTPPKYKDFLLRLMLNINNK
ncbi:unnamed protein product, partial [Brenthis ino]